MTPPPDRRGPLAARCRAAFRSADRERGEVSFLRRAVREVECRDLGIRASVRGSRPAPYQVSLSWNRDGTQLEASCSCSQFDDFGRCKHLWAVVLASDARGLGESVPGKGSLLLIDDRSRASTDEARRGGTKPPVDGRADERRGGAARWQRALLDLGSSLAEEAGSSRSGTPERRRQRAPGEIWYVIDAEASRQRGGLLVALYERRRGRGEPPRIVPLAVHGRLLHSLPDGEDRALLELFLSLGQPGRQALDPRADWPRTESAILPLALYATILPRLAATGRLSWCAGGEPDLETRLRWEPLGWSLRLRLERGEDGGVAARGELIRPRLAAAEETQEDPSEEGEIEARPISDPVLLLRGGVVVFAEAVAPLETPGGFGWVATLRRRGAIELPATEVEEGLNGLWQLPSLPPLSGPTELIPARVRAQPTPRLRLRSLGRGEERATLIGEVAFLYGEEAVEPDDALRREVFDPRSGRFLERDRELERRALRRLRDLGLRPPSGWAGGASRLTLPAQRMVEVSERLLEAGWRVEAEGVPVRAGGLVRFSVASRIDWLDVRARIDFGDARAELPEILAAVRRGERFVTLGDGSRGLLPEEWLARFHGLVRLACDGADDGGEALRFQPSQALLLDLLLRDSAERGAEIDLDAGFGRQLELLARPESAAAALAPAGFRGELRPYQRVGLGWFQALAEAGIGGCLADDMGLGKTVQVLALLQARRERPAPPEGRRPSLVVAPRSLVFNWIEEAARFAPRLQVADLSGADRSRLLEEPERYDLLVTTYGVVRREVDTLEVCRFESLILDEAQTVKNPGTQAARAVRRLRAEHRLALTGTPIENHLGELWSLLDFLNPGLLGSMGPRLIEKTTGGGPLTDEELDLLARTARPFLLRRRKEEVLHELPPKTEQTLWCELGPQQRSVYEELREYYRVRVSERVEEAGIDRAQMLVLEALLRLRQAACHPALIDAESPVASSKVELLLDQLTELREEGHKAIVFSQFTKLLALVRARLDEAGISWEQLDGRTRNRRERVARFQSDPDCGVFLVSLKAGGTGLNLTAAHYVFLLDPWWNPAVEAQAIDRAHRMGQSQPVFAYRLIARDTVEEKILALQRHKRRIADAILSAEASTLRGLTAEEVAELLG